MGRGWDGADRLVFASVGLWSLVRKRPFDPLGRWLKGTPLEAGSASPLPRPIGFVIR
jgi:hypothetical protein